MTEETLVAPRPAARRRLLADALVYTLANVACAAIPFLMLPILTRVLTPQEYGTVAMFSVAVAFFSALTGLSVHGAVGVRFFDRDTIDFPRYIATCLAILACSTAVVLAGVWLALPWLQSLTNLPGTWLAVAVLVSCATFIVQIQLAVWQSSRQPWRYGALRMFQAGTDALGSLVLVLSAGLAWQGRLGGIAFAAVATAMAAAVLLARGGWVRGPLSRDYAANALRFGVPLVPHAFGAMLTGILDRVLITNMVGVASTGVYMVALQIGMVLGLLTDSFNRAFAPWLIESLRTSDTRRDIAVVRYTYVYFALVLLGSAVVGLAAPAVLSVLVGDRFAAAAPIVLYTMLGYAFGGMYYMVTNYVFFAGRTQWLAAVTLTGGVVNAAASYLLIRDHGAIGAAQAFVLAQALTFAGTWWLAQQSRPMPWLKALQPTPAKGPTP